MADLRILITPGQQFPSKFFVHAATPPHPYAGRPLGTRSSLNTEHPARHVRACVTVVCNDLDMVEIAGPLDRNRLRQVLDARGIDPARTALRVVIRPSATCSKTVARSGLSTTPSAGLKRACKASQVRTWLAVIWPTCSGETRRCEDLAERGMCGLSDADQTGTDSPCDRS